MEKVKDENIKGGYTIEHGVLDDNVGTLPPSLSKKGEKLPTIINNLDAKLKKKFLENPEPIIDKPKKSFPKGRKMGKNYNPLPKGRTVRILPRHRAVMETMQNNGGKITKAMIAMSYAPSTISQNVIEKTKSWKMLMEEHLPEDLIALRHSELINKRARRNIKNAKGEIIEYDVDDGPDTPAVVKALELAYKLRGSFAAEKVAESKNVIYNLFYKPEVREAMKSFEDNLKLQIANDADKKIKNDIRDAETRDVGPEPESSN